ncbi:hypothetical protein ElyMa_002416600 [Elysia marginata]|uniref:Uncharacterized protein n=1 Tax=Elysia marginata TaxID=1093978 RepID=A0AAV4GJ17_9GAST|nr:hypothetical protein ElyMa_002416600 [Elysia marginata]
MDKQVVAPVAPMPEDMICEYLSIKEQIATLTKREKELKAEIGEFADTHIENFDSEGVFELETGLIKISKNPPKAIWVDSEKALSLAEKKDIVMCIPQSYHNTTIDLTKVARAKESDKQLKQALKAKGVEVVQETRYDIKSKK